MLQLIPITLIPKNSPLGPEQYHTLAMYFLVGKITALGGASLLLIFCLPCTKAFVHPLE